MTLSPETREKIEEHRDELETLAEDPDARSSWAARRLLDAAEGGGD